MEKAKLRRGMVQVLLALSRRLRFLRFNGFDAIRDHLTPEMLRPCDAKRGDVHFEEAFAS